ncbi:lipoprotein-anchoring transpeptidase ErfK/SrfK [Angulomicrobium amanitiforme]|uniref:Lipoprotein-anchoring transpeptidase ErfK/SrfK n=2 Tax=Ancylobacter amanitiformis TaxID=217069 RepID=A0ABU0LLE1_9HYPH|nr:lipoprotein-anchoring transpeptidase ErfK/SrfK [Ancylobacter amanitiformis]
MMMVARLGFVPAVAFTVLASVGSAAAQYNSAAPQAGSAYEAATGNPVNEDVQVPAAYDPYAGTNAAVAPQAAPGTPAPYYAQPAAGVAAQPPGAVPGAPADARYASPASQPAGYPPGAYSGQQPVGAPSPYGATAAAAPVNSAPPAYGQSAAAPAPRQDLNNNYGANGSSVAMLPAEDQPEEGPAKELPANLKRQVVDYPTTQAPGTIVIDTSNTYLYLVMGGGKAERYGIGVGRDGFTWAGTEKISRKAEWADWRPPAEMIERQPYLPRFMAGGPGNPLGARTMYLGGTIYRIHGTNQPSTIGQFMSSGCIRMLNEDVEALYEKVKVGTKVVVLPGSSPKTAAADGSMAPMPVSASVSASNGLAVH